MKPGPAALLLAACLLAGCQNATPAPGSPPPGSLNVSVGGSFGMAGAAVSQPQTGLGARP